MSRSFGATSLTIRLPMRTVPDVGDSRPAMIRNNVDFPQPEGPTSTTNSAAGVYQQVVKTHPNSPRAPAALYKLGLLAEQRGDKAAARTYYARVIAGYPRSDEANLARDKLQRLGR